MRGRRHAAWVTAVVVEVVRGGRRGSGAQLCGLHPGTWKAEVHGRCFLRSDHSGGGQVEGEAEFCLNMLV